MHCMIVLAIMKLKFAHCVRILWQALLSLTIPIKCDVLHALHDGIGDGIPSQTVIYCQNLHVSLVVSITGNTCRFDASSFDPHSVHIGLPPDSRDSSYNG